MYFFQTQFYLTVVAILFLAINTSSRCGHHRRDGYPESVTMDVRKPFDVTKHKSDYLG